MTTSHTPGRLKIGRVSHSEQSAEIDAESPTAWMDAYPWEGLAECRGCNENKTLGAAAMVANARRLVACWNALDGIPTTEIEAAARSGSISYALAKVIAQRDELLEALKDLAQSIVWKEFGECRGFSDSMPLPVITAVEKARAAIAKAEGGEA